MADISQTIFSDVFSWMKSFVVWIKISLKFVPKGPIDNNPAQGSHKNLRKISMIFPWLLQAKIQISRQKKNQYVSLLLMYQFVESITDRHRRTLTHRHTPTIQLILLVIELIQEVKTTLVNLIDMGNRFSN